MKNYTKEMVKDIRTGCDRKMLIWERGLTVQKLIEAVEKEFQLIPFRKIRVYQDDYRVVLEGPV